MSIDGFSFILIEFTYINIVLNEIYPASEIYVILSVKTNLRE